MTASHAASYPSVASQQAKALETASLRSGLRRMVYKSVCLNIRLSFRNQVYKARQRLIRTSTVLIYIFKYIYVGEKGIEPSMTN